MENGWGSIDGYSMEDVLVNPMNKLTNNQEHVMECLTDEYLMFGDICNVYGKRMEVLGFNPCGRVWKSEVGRILNAMIKHGLVEYQYRGLYRKNQETIK